MISKNWDGILRDRGTSLRRDVRLEESAKTHRPQGEGGGLGEE